MINTKEIAMRMFLKGLVVSLFCATAFLAQNSFSAVSQTRVATIAYATTNVSTSAYVTLVASSPISTTYIEFCDTSTKVMKVATGTSGFEKDIATSNVSGCIVVPYYIPANTRISIEAATAAATTGFGVLSFIP